MIVKVLSEEVFEVEAGSSAEPPDEGEDKEAVDEAAGAGEVHQGPRPGLPLGYTRYTGQTVSQAPEVPPHPQPVLRLLSLLLTPVLLLLCWVVKLPPRPGGGPLLPPSPGSLLCDGWCPLHLLLQHTGHLLQQLGGCLDLG